MLRKREQVSEPETDPAIGNHENAILTVLSDHDYHSSCEDPCLAYLNRNSVLHSLVTKVSWCPVIVWLQKDEVFSSLPNIVKGAYRNTRYIIDCSEIYIEIPKSLNIQASTWSEYKKHNTFKFLIAIAPSGYITYISDCYGEEQLTNLYAKIVASITC